MASLLDIMNKNKSLSGIRMGYEVSDYNEILEKLYVGRKTTRIVTDGGSGVSANGVLAGAYIPAINELVDSGYDLSSVNFSDTGFSIGDDENKRLASLTFVPNRGFVAVSKNTDEYSMVAMPGTEDRRFVYGNSTCGNYVSPPVTLNKEIIESGKTNSEGGQYRVGCCIDATGMFKDYLMHFYPNENIGIGLKNGSIKPNSLEKLIAERCLYAEVSFGSTSKTAFFSVTDSYKSAAQNELYIRIDAPICTTSSLSSVFSVEMDKNHESIHLSSSYDFKKGSLKLCDTEKYLEYAGKYSNKTFEGKIKLTNPSKLGVRFFCLPEKKSVVESIVGTMPDDFYKTNSDFKTDMSNAVTYSGIEFVNGDVQEARRTFYEKRGPVPNEVLQRLRAAHDEFMSHRNEPFFKRQFTTREGTDAKVGVNCSEFIIPDGYPITFGHPRFRHQVTSNRPWSTLTDERIVSVGDNGSCSGIIRGYEDHVYADIFNKAKGEVRVKCNMYLGKLLTEIFKAILDYYGGQNLPKIVPSLCVLTSGIRCTTRGWAHRCGRALDFDYYNNYETRKRLIWDGRNTNYKGFLEIIRASGFTDWPIGDIARKPNGQRVKDDMHFQW